MAVADGETFRGSGLGLAFSRTPEGIGTRPAGARDFGYSPGAFRVLCHKFRRETDLEERYFKDVRRGPQAAPARDRVREHAVALRKRNLSVYDIQHELREQGHALSINSLAILLREEGFARLPRRGDDERPQAPKPERAPAADARALDLSPRSFRTRVAGLFLFVPLMRNLDLHTIADQARPPGSKRIPAEHALRSLLALKLIGKERKSRLKVDFDLQITLMASSLYRLLALRLADAYRRATAKKIFRNLLDVPGFVEIERRQVVVTLDKRAHNPYLVDSGLADQPTPMPWCGGRKLVIQFA